MPQKGIPMFEKEHWGPPVKNKRYSRIKDKVKFDTNYAQINWVGAVDPAKGRKFRKVYPKSESK